MNRPTSITVISWYLIISSILSVIFILIGMNAPSVVAELSKTNLSPEFLLGISIIGGAITFIAAVFLLKGNALARKIYIGFALASIIINFLLSPSVMIIPAIVITGIIVYFLFSPKANAYFLAEER